MAATALYDSTTSTQHNHTHHMAAMRPKGTGFLGWKFGWCLILFIVVFSTRLYIDIGGVFAHSNLLKHLKNSVVMLIIAV